VTKKESYTEGQIERSSHWTFFHYHEFRQGASLLTAISPDNLYYDAKHYSKNKNQNTKNIILHADRISREHW
jgi:hypothetical protein